MNFKFEVGKPYKTRSGQDVRIYATDHGSGLPIAGAIKIDGDWVLHRWTESGRWTKNSMIDHGNDLMQTKTVKLRIALCDDGGAILLDCLQTEEASSLFGISDDIEVTIRTGQNL